MRYRGDFVWKKPLPSPKWVSYWIRKGWSHDPISTIAADPELARLVGPEMLYTRDPIIAACSNVVMWNDSLSALKEFTEPSYAVDTAFMPECVSGLSYMPFQRAGIEYIINMFINRGLKCSLLADDMGLGKTVQALGVIYHLKNAHNESYSVDEPVVIICPSSLQLTWKREVVKWLGDNPGVIKVFDGLKTQPGDVIICSYGRAEKLLSQLIDSSVEPSMLIVDEAHLIKNPNSKRSQVVAFGRGRNLFSRSKRAILLTGTPSPNRPGDAWALYHLLNRDVWPRMVEFQKRVNGEGDGDMLASVNRRIAGVKSRILGMLRRRKLDVLKDLPDKIRKVVELIPESRMERGAISGERKAYEDAMGSITLKAAAMMPIGSHAMTARKKLASLKAPRAAKYLKETMAPYDKVIIFTYFSETMDILMGKLKSMNPVCMSGGMTTEEKQAAVDRFQNDQTVKVFIGQLIVANVGWNLQAANRVLVVDLDWTPARHEQAEDRAWRIGQMRSVLIEYLVYQGSIDARIAISLGSKTSARKEMTE